MRAASIFVALSLLLAACGEHERSGEFKPEPIPPPAPPAAPVPQARDSRPKIVALGDSITAGFGVAPAQAYPAVIERTLDTAGFRYQVVNSGVSGDTTSNGLERLSEVLALKPTLVIVELGGNDGLRGIPFDTTRANLEEMITSIERNGATVVLAGMTLPPNYGPDYIRQFEKMYQDLAARQKLKLIPFRLELLGAGPAVKLMQNDGLHPTAEGHRRLGEYVARQLVPLLPHR